MIAKHRYAIGGPRYDYVRVQRAYLPRMPMKLDCPLEGCHASIEAETEQEVMAQVEDHASSDHPDLELNEETVESIRSAIKVV